MSELVLSLFPGIGLLDIAFEEIGFCVVRGPDLIWGGDIHKFHPPIDKFSGIIGGPPCQAFSQLRRLLQAQGNDVSCGNLIPEFERCIYEAQPEWFLMENVPKAPILSISGYIVHTTLLNNRQVGGAQSRVRRFSFGSHFDTPLQIDYVTRENLFYYPTVPAGNDLPPSQRDRGYKDSVSYRAVAQGLPSDFLDHCPMTMKGKKSVIGNGVPLPMGRAIARAVAKAIGFEIDACG